MLSGELKLSFEEHSETEFFDKLNDENLIARLALNLVKFN